MNDIKTEGKPLIDVYLNKIKQLIILISGLSGSGRSEIAKNIAKIFNFPLIQINNYYKKDYNETITMGENKIINWSDINAFDWVTINNEINLNKKTGIVVVGTIFTNDVIDFVPDIYINIKISKSNLLNNRYSFLKNHEDDIHSLYIITNSYTDLLIFNKIILPQYYNYLNNSKIHKFFNANDITSIDELEELIFNYIITTLELNLNNYFNSNKINNVSSSTKSSNLINSNNTNIVYSSTKSSNFINSNNTNKVSSSINLSDTSNITNDDTSYTSDNTSHNTNDDTSDITSDDDLEDDLEDDIEDDIEE